MIGKIIEFLSGKKTTITNIIWVIVVFSFGRGYIKQDVVDLISGLMLALGLTANIATAKYFSSKSVVR